MVARAGRRERYCRAFDSSAVNASAGAVYADCHQFRWSNAIALWRIIYSPCSAWSTDIFFQRTSADACSIGKCPVGICQRTMDIYSLQRTLAEFADANDFSRNRKVMGMESNHTAMASGR